MGCSSSSEVGVGDHAVTKRSPQGINQPRNPNQDQVSQPRPPQSIPHPQFQSRIPPPQQKRLPQHTSTSGMPPPPPPSSSVQAPPTSNAHSSTLRAVSIPGTWPRVVKLGSSPVSVFVHSHDFSNPPNEISCWTFVSQGLSQVSQPEVVFTIARRSNESVEAFPRCPLDWMMTVYGLAKAGVHMETGMIIELMFDRGAVFLKHNQTMLVQDPGNWQTMSRFGSLVLGISLSNSCFKFPGGVLPSNAHHVIALTHEETAVAKQFGVTRVIAHLGLSVRWFPYPPWIDRDRGDTVTMADQAGSIRMQMPIARIYGVNATRYEDDVVLTIPAGDERRQAFKDYILGQSVNAAAAFESFMNESADSGLTWRKGQRVPVIYGKNCDSMDCLNIAFLMIASEQSRDDCTMVEDGYGLFFRNGTWQNIRDAIQHTMDITIQLDGGNKFILNWERTSFLNPVDGREYVGSWRTYNPRSGRPAAPVSDSHVKLAQVIFLQEPPPGTVDVTLTAKYVENVRKVLEESIALEPLPPPPGIAHPGRQAVVEIELPKRAGWLKMTVLPIMHDMDIQNMMSRIASLQEPEAKAVLKVQLYFDLWGKDNSALPFA